MAEIFKIGLQTQVWWGPHQAFGFIFPVFKFQTLPPANLLNIPASYLHNNI